MAKSNFTDFLSPLFEKVEELSKNQRIMICIGVVLSIVLCFGYFSYYKKWEKISKLRKVLVEEKKKLETAKRNAKMIDSYRKKMAEAKVQFEIVKRALPEKEEIPSLLANISQSGKDSGLEFLLFQPNPEVKKQYYTEIPVSINVTGTYHDTAIFFDRVGGLSRIVNLDQIKINPDKAGSFLKTSCKAVTYKFVESADQKKKK